MSVPRKVVIDFETYLITPGCNTPRPICFAILDEIPALYTRHEHADKIVADLKRALTDENCLLIGHNIIFDLAVACAEWPELIPLVFDAFAAGRVWDNMIVELLYNMAHGEIDYRPSSVPGVMQKSGYGLDDLARRWLGVCVEKKDTWRLRYPELDYVPLAEWPPEAVSYPLGDVEIPLKTQAAQVEAISKLFDGKRTRMPDHEAQHRAAWWMYLMSTWGVRTNVESVRALQDEIEKEMSTLSHGLVKSGVLTMALKRDMKKVREYVVAGYTAQGLVECVPKTPTGAISTDEETLEASKHPALQTLGQYVHLQKMLNTYVLGKGKKNAPGIGLVHGIDAPICARYRVLVATGRTSCSKPNLQNPPREGGVRECFQARDGYAYVGCDYDTAELRALAQVVTEKVGYSVLGDVIREGKDPHLMFAAQLMGRTYEYVWEHRKEKAVKDVRQYSKCFHPDTEALTRNGWKKIGDLTMQDEVAQAIPLTDRVMISWTHPTALQRIPNEKKLIHLKNEGIDLRVTPDHRMLQYNLAGEWAVTTPQKFGGARKWASAGTLPDGVFRCQKVDDNLLRLAVAVQADGSYGTGHQIRLGFTKQRKIERLKELLKSFTDWSLREHVQNGKPATTFTLNRELAEKVKNLLDEKKLLPWWWLDLPITQRKLVLEEVRFWDSHVIGSGRSYHYTTVERQNADVLQAMGTITGMKSRCSVEAARNERCRPSISVAMKDRWYSRGGSLTPVEIDHDGDVVCLSVPSSFVVVRDGGVPVITGQCANFGYPGGLGAESFVAFAKGYGITLTLAESQHLRDQWFKTFPEMKKYFEKIAEEIGTIGEATIRTLGSGRLHGARGFCQAANLYFQGMVADGAKRAGWFISYECYVDEASPLYGSRIAMFLHDEFILETPVEKVHTAAKRLEELMIVGMSHFIKVVPVTCTAAAMRRWYKGYEPVLVDDKLVPGEPVEVDGETKWVEDRRAA